MTSAKEVAHSLNDKLRLKLTPRPWNLHRPDDSLYWLVPSGEWPAYRYAKFVFSSGSDYPRRVLADTTTVPEPTKLFVGFNIEKGFGEVASLVDSSLKRKQQIQDKDWDWFTFIQPDAAERFAVTLSRLSETELTHVYAVVSYVHDRESTSTPDHDAVVFKCEGNELTAIVNQLPLAVLPRLRHTTWKELIDALKAVDDYYWVDLYAGTYIDTSDIDVLAFNRNVLSYFQPWVEARG